MDYRFKGRRMALLLKKLSLMDHLSKKDYRVFNYLLDELRKGIYISIHQARVADYLDLSPSQVSKAIKQLVEDQIIEAEDDGLWIKRYRLVDRSEQQLRDDIDELLGYDDDDDDDDDDDE